MTTTKLNDVEIEVEETKTETKVYNKIVLEREKAELQSRISEIDNLLKEFK